MTVSKIGICNIALAHLGADAIRSFDENNKRSRMCNTFFDTSRDYLLQRFDWPFAKKFKRLQPLDLPDDEKVPGYFAYQLPNDCKVPRDLHPPGSRDPWEVMGDMFLCKRDPEYYQAADQYTGPGLYYTVIQTDMRKFSSTFVNLLALLMAVRIGYPLTQDKQLMGTLAAQYQREQMDVWESDANIGNDYRAYDEDPNNDTFVYPEGYYVEEEINRWTR